MASFKPRHAHFDLRGSHHYLTPVQRVPGYLPYKNPVSPGDIPVPNEADMFWPHGQFAPKFFPSGSKSFTPFEFPSNAEMDESAHLILKNDEREFGDPALPEETGFFLSEKPVAMWQALLMIGACVFVGYQLKDYVDDTRDLWKLQDQIKEDQRRRK